jgi:hypothetical protein
MKNTISTVFFTNEKSFDITNLSIPFYLSNFEDLDINVYVISNKIPENSIKYDGVTYYDAGINFDGQGYHFAPLLSNFLKTINSEYVFLLCDDYIFLSPVKLKEFNGLINLCDDLQIDLVSFNSLRYNKGLMSDWVSPNINYDDYFIPKDCLVETNSNFKHLFSLQPCIWRRASLLELLEYNPTLSVHELDTSNVKNKEHKYRPIKGLEGFDNQRYDESEVKLDYNFKCFSFYLDPISFNIDEKPLNSGYIIIDYIEVMRHGKFNDADTNSKLLLNEIIKTLPDNIKQIINKFN